MARLLMVSDGTVRNWGWAGRTSDGRLIERKDHVDGKYKHLYRVQLDGPMVTVEAKKEEAQETALVPYKAPQKLLCKPTVELPPITWRTRITALLRKVASVRGIKSTDHEAHHELRRELYNYHDIRTNQNVRLKVANHNKRQGSKLSAIEYMEREGMLETLYACGWELYADELGSND
jgi:hypothetical protein